MSAAAASWQKQLVYEFKELEGLQDAALLADSQVRLQQACSRLVAQLVAADGAPQQQQQLVVLLRLIPLPALVKRVLRCANKAPPEVSAIDDDLIRTKWWIDILCTHSSSICSVLAVSTALLRAGVPCSEGVLCGLPGVQAAAAAVVQSKALDMVARMQCRLTQTHLRKNADLLPASAAETLTQTAAHLMTWCAAARVLCALAAGQDYLPEQDSVVTATLECLAWQLAISIGQGSRSSDAAASSSVGKADCSSSSSGRSGGCSSSRMLVAESVLAAIHAMSRHTAVGQMDYLQDRNHWWLNVLLVLVDSHLAVQALATGAATPGAAAVAAAVGSGATSSCAPQPPQQQQQLAARVSSTIQAMLQVMDVTPWHWRGWQLRGSSRSVPV